MFYVLGSKLTFLHQLGPLWAIRGSLWPILRPTWGLGWQLEPLKIIFYLCIFSDVIQIPYTMRTHTPTPQPSCRLVELDELSAVRHILPSHMVKDPGVKARTATIHVRTKTSVGAKTCESLVLSLR